MLLCSSRVSITYSIVWVNSLWGKSTELLRLFSRSCDTPSHPCDRLTWLWASVAELLRLFNWSCDPPSTLVTHWPGFELRSLSCWDCSLGLWCTSVCSPASVVRDWAGAPGTLPSPALSCTRPECSEAGLRSYCTYHRAYQLSPAPPTAVCVKVINWSTFCICI